MVSAPGGGHLGKKFYICTVGSITTMSREIDKNSYQKQIFGPKIGVKTRHFSIKSRCKNSKIDKMGTKTQPFGENRVQNSIISGILLKIYIVEEKGGQSSIFQLNLGGQSLSCFEKGGSFKRHISSKLPI